ncbi:MAG: hypothetical protein QXV97_07510 [Candidatus Caldarchaeum sp.]
MEFDMERALENPASLRMNNFRLSIVVVSRTVKAVKLARVAGFIAAPTIPAAVLLHYGSGRLLVRDGVVGFRTRHCSECGKRLDKIKVSRDRLAAVLTDVLGSLSLLTQGGHEGCRTCQERWREKKGWLGIWLNMGKGRLEGEQSYITRAAV